jgi:hypothetical protein
MVLGRGIEPRSPALQAGAFTRLAFRAHQRVHAPLDVKHQRVHARLDVKMVRPARIELASSEWHSEALPIDQGRMVGVPRIELGMHLRRRFYRPAQSPDLATPEDLATPGWLQRTESNGLPRGHEPRELPMLHTAQGCEA